VALYRSRTRKLTPYTRIPRFITTCQIATHDDQSGLSRANAFPAARLRLRNGLYCVGWGVLTQSPSNLKRS